MRRTGSARASAAALLVFFAIAPVAAAQDEVEFYQTVDRTVVGTEDTFKLTVVVVNPPAGAEISLPPLDNFEVLSKSPINQRSIQVTGQGTRIEQVTKWVLVLRPKKVGTLTLGPSTLNAGDSSQKTEGLQIEVKKGRVSEPGGGPSAQRPRDPFQDFFGPGSPFQDPFEQLPREEIPTTDSDLFIRTYLDDKDVYVGEQVTLSVYVFSRVDLSSVDSVTLPKLEGFWSEDIDSPTQLAGEQKIINGVPYRAYLLKRKALFPTRAGKIEIDPVEAEITTGYLFAGSRVRRVGNTATLNVKPLPPGAPPGFSATHVGRWQLRVEAVPTEVKLGDPVTVRVTLEGRGNVKNVTPPRLSAPSSFKVYDPTTTDRMAPRNGVLGGRRTQEYLVMPTRTGTFTLPALEFPYFNPEKNAYDVARSEPISIQVRPGSGGAPSAAATEPGEVGPKNVLTAEGGVQPLRHEADLSVPGEPVWRQPWFLPVTLSPFGLWAALSALGLVRSRLGREDVTALRRKRAKDARRRLAAAEKLRASGAPAEFYGEVEKALITFLDAKLGEPVVGLTRDALALRLAELGISEEARARIVGVLETCEAGRYAPGGGDPSARDRVLDDAEAAMEGLEKR